MHHKPTKGKRRGLYHNPKLVPGLNIYLSVEIDCFDVVKVSCCWDGHDDVSLVAVRHDLNLCGSECVGSRAYIDIGVFAARCEGCCLSGEHFLLADGAGEKHNLT